MSVTAKIQTTIALSGLTLTQQGSLAGDYSLAQNAVVPAAKTGSLTTRTDNTTGTITGATGHGIATSDLIDVYWTGGSRSAVVVGTVATNSIPISGGAGDNLPIATTPLTLMKRTQLTTPFAAAKLRLIAVRCPVRAIISIEDGSGVLLLIKLAAGQVYEWDAGSLDTNPISGTATKTNISHESSSAQQTIPLALLLNN